MFVATCILMLSAPAPSSAVVDVVDQFDGFRVCVADVVTPPAYKIVFPDESALCVQRPWRTSTWITLDDDCACLE